MDFFQHNFLVKGIVYFIHASNFVKKSHE